MPTLDLKYLAILLSHVFPVIRKSGIAIRLKGSIEELQKSVSLKNRSRYLSIRMLIEKYSNFHKNDTEPRFDAWSLWQIADSKFSYKVLEYVTKNDKAILDLFEDVNDIIHISRKPGSSKVLAMLIKDNTAQKIVDRVGEIGLVQLSRSDGCKYVLEMILDDDTYGLLVERVGSDEVIHIGCRTGARLVLKLILNDKYYQILIQRLGKDGLVKMAKNGGASQALKMILSKDYDTLLDRLGKENLIKVGSYDGSKQVLDLFLDKQAFELLVRRLGFDMLIKVSCKLGARRVLDLILKTSLFEELRERLGQGGLLKILSKAGGAQVLQVFLKKNAFNRLVTCLGKDGVFRVGCQNGAKQVFDLILKKDNFDILSKRLDKEDLIKIASHGGGCQVLSFFLNQQKYDTLRQFLGEEGLIKIANTNGSKNVFDMFLKKGLFDTLVRRLGKDGLIKVCSRCGSRKILNLILDNNVFAKLKQSIGAEWLVKLASSDGSYQILKMLLKPDLFSILSNRLGKDVILKIACFEGSKLVLDLFLKKGTIDILLSRLGEDGLTKIACNNSARLVLDLILDGDKHATLLERLGAQGLIQVANNHSSSTILKVVLDDERWCFLKSVFPFPYLIGMLSKQKLRLSLVNISKNHKLLSRYLSKKSLYRYASLSHKNQSGLEISCLHNLINTFKFDEDEILVLAKLSGRFLPYIIRLIQQHESKIHTLFEGCVRLSTPSSYSDHFKNKKDVLFKRLDEKGRWLISLVELNQYCINEALTLDELFLLRSYEIQFSSIKNAFVQIGRLIKLTGIYSISERKHLWEILSSKEYMIENTWFCMLNALSPLLRKWFIQRGEGYINFLFYAIPHTFSKMKGDYTIKDQEFLMFCMQNVKVRAFVVQMFYKHLSVMVHNFSQYLISEQNNSECVVSVESDHPLHALDWIRMVLTIYDFYDCKKPHDCETYVLKPCLNYLTSHKLKKLKTNYPKVVLNHGKVYVNIQKELLNSILNPSIAFYNDNVSVSLHNSRKRGPYKEAVFVPDKRKKLSENCILGMLKDLSQDISKNEWASIEYYLKDADQNSVDKISDAILCRYPNDIPPPILALLPPFCQSAMQLENASLEKGGEESEFSQSFFTLLDNFDWDNMLDLELLSVETQDANEALEFEKEWISEMVSCVPSNMSE